MAELSMPALQQALNTMDGAITASEKVLEPFLNVPLKTAVGQMPPLDNARLNNALSFIATALVYAHLRIGGIDTASHAIKEEIDATRKVFTRVEEAKKVLDARERKSVSAVNKEAADRFIKAGIREPLQSYSGAVRPRAAIENDGEPDSETEDAKLPSNIDEPRTSSARSTPTAKRPKPHDKSRTEAKERKPKTLDDKKRSTPQPHLSHVNWKEEMATKFGSAKSGK